MSRTALLTALLLGACGQAPDNRICETPPQEGRGDLVKTCIHRQAYALASAQGSTASIAASVLTACEQPITIRAAVAASRSEANVSAMVRLRQELKEQFQPEAEMRVTQARAGHCEPPAAKVGL